MLRIARQGATALSRGRFVTTKTASVGAPSAVQPVNEKDLPTITECGQAFPGDLRSTSGLGVGDGIASHTEKWMNGNGKSPMQYIQEAEPIKVHGLVVASYGSPDLGLGAPVQYISLKGTSKERPAVCKYTGNKYYSDDWMHGGSH